MPEDQSHSKPTRRHNSVSTPRHTISRVIHRQSRQSINESITPTIQPFSIVTNRQLNLLGCALVKRPSLGQVTSHHHQNGGFLSLTTLSAIVTATPCRVTGGRLVKGHSASSTQALTKKSGKTPTVEGQLSSRLDDEDREADDDTPIHFMIEFWSRLRAVPDTNSYSVGLDAFDRLVLRLLADDTSQAPLESAVVILPSPESMSAGQVRGHSVFQAPVTQTRPKRSSSRTPPKPPSSQETAHVQEDKSQTSLLVYLPTGVDATIERDLERLVKISEGQVPTPRAVSAGGQRCRSPQVEGKRAPSSSAIVERLLRRDGLQRDAGGVDCCGYRSIPTILETSYAIDPTLPKNLQVSDKPLVRIALSVSGSNPLKESWVGNRNRGRWKKLLSYRSLRVPQVEVVTLLTAGKPYLAYYLRLSSDEEDQKKEEGHPGNDHDDEENKAQEDTNEDADDQDDEEDDEEAAKNYTSTDNGATFDPGDNPSKILKPSSTSPDAQTPK
ncbi:hypothetical protein GN958_ATG09230 [Phytophthora infestans]|uniref:Uncharacterized protein n=1 Tax=Phytophthora infestans TaxID=4787 RepID=A0A8S9ULD3_PHYIN|nr:hypothetical protein GN958_ATG09230 [Phytophthora infestans]